MQRLMSSLAFGLAIGAVGVLTHLLPFGQAWEADSGLEGLFRLRGARPPPPEVRIVAIDDATAGRLGVPAEMTQWPRALYARLVDRLAAAGASVIVFDIDFRKPRDTAGDAALADSIRRAGNVLLFAYLEQEAVEVNAAPSPAAVDNRLHIQRLRPPLPELADAAYAVAPFVLPKIPVKVNRFWTFQGANELPSLPVVALERHAAAMIDDPPARLRELAPGWVPGPEPGTVAGTDNWSALRASLRNGPRQVEELMARLRSDSAASLSPRERDSLLALVSLYALPDYPWLNFYGPPQTVTTLPLAQVLQDDPAVLADIAGKAVFVGYAGRYQPRQKDGFYTVFSQPSGLDLSGVEIAATAFGNLIGVQTLHRAGATATLPVLLLYGLALALLLRLQHAPFIIAAALLAASGYFAAVYLLFARANLWLPWMTPLFVQTPLALLMALLWHYREAQHGRKRLRELFGYYLPGHVVDRLAQDTGRARMQGEVAFGVCLATDAEQYTRMAETMKPAELQDYMNRYYEILFAPVRARGGIISDVIGDAMLAIWSAPAADAELRRHACEAAVEISRALQASDLQPRLRTRIGLHAGELVMSHIGAIDHFEYRAVGDIVNTASRIESLNKQLGTQILASGQTLEGLGDFTARDLGLFRLRGKQQSLRLYAIPAAEDALPDPRLQAAFAQALARFEAQDWPGAQAGFEAVLESRPDDGPSRYYLELCRERLNVVS